jgi:hypothetical protein
MVGSSTICPYLKTTDPISGALNSDPNSAFSHKGSNLDNWGFTDSVNLGGYSEAKIVFAEKYEIVPEGSSDKGYIKISDNGGSSWTTLLEFQGTVDWRYNFFELNNWLGETIMIGFQYVTGSESISQGWSVDKIYIEADAEIIYEENFAEYNDGDPWGDWIVKSDMNPENDPPYNPKITGNRTGKENRPQLFQFKAQDPDLDPVSYFVDWGDGEITDWTKYYHSGSAGYSEEHIWADKGTYKIKAKARDINGQESDWTEHNIRITTPRSSQTNNLLIRYLESLLDLILESFPILSKIINLPLTV